MPSSYVVERKAAGIYALTAEERQQEEDVRWALHDPNVLANYVGEFVVPVDRRIVAHGQDIESVLTEAARLTGRNPERLPICGIDDPLLDLPH
jgi:ABC-type cobalamin/Fe3+-siderophores transport system ATPase subunit